MQAQVVFHDFFAEPSIADIRKRARAFEVLTGQEPEIYVAGEFMDDQGVIVFKSRAMKVTLTRGRLVGQADGEQARLRICRLDSIEFCAH